MYQIALARAESRPSTPPRVRPAAGVGRRDCRECSLETAGWMSPLTAQYVVPYFISSHPGSDLNAMIDLAVFLKRNGYRPDQVQDFIPAPFDVATCMYYTGLDPFTGEEVHVAKPLRERKTRRALLQFFKPENYFEVREALLKAGRGDLIGSGCDCPIPARAPREALNSRRRRANEAVTGDHYHAVANPARGEPVGERGLPNAGYRPGRKTARRQDKSRKPRVGGR